MISKKFGVGLLLQVGLKLCAVGLGFFTTRWLITVLSSNAYETYNLIDAYNRAILMIITLGIPVLIQKFYTNHHDSKELGNFWTTMVLTRLASFVLGVVLILISFPLSQTNNLVLILGFFVAQYILLFDLNYRSVCDAKGHSWQFSLTDFLGKLILVVILYAGVFLKVQNINLEYFIFAAIFAYFMALMIDVILQWKHTPFGRFDLQILKNNFKPLMFLTLSTFTVALYLNTDRLFLKYFGYQELVVNGYTNAYKLLEIATIIPGLTMPPIASFVKKRMDKDQASRIGEEIFKTFAKFRISKKTAIILEWAIFCLILGISTTLGILIFGPFVIQLLDPTLKYPLALQALPILAVSMIPMTPMLFFTNIMIFLGGEKYELISTTLAAIFGIIFYLTLIPALGIVGVSIATLGIYTLELIVKSTLLARQMKKKSVL